MSKLIEELYEAMATGCGAYMEASHLSEILAHIKQLEANQIPDGSVAVPREPTMEMHSAGRNAYMLVQSPITFPECPDKFIGKEYMPIWRAMINAATHGEGE